MCVCVAMMPFGRNIFFQIAFKCFLLLNPMLYTFPLRRHKSIQLIGKGAISFDIRIVYLIVTRQVGYASFL